MNYQLRIETATGGHFEPGTYTLDAARQVTMATAGEPGGMDPMDGVLLKDGERKLMFNFEEEQWMPAKPCPFQRDSNGLRPQRDVWLTTAFRKERECSERQEWGRIAD